MIPPADAIFPATAAIDRTIPTVIASREKSALMSTCMPICRKNMGTNNVESGTRSRSRVCSSCCRNILECSGSRISPAENAPTMGASPNLWARYAEAKQRVSESVSSIPLSSAFAAQRNRGLLKSRPRMVPTTRKPKAFMMMTVIAQASPVDSA